MLLLKALVEGYLLQISYVLFCCFFFISRKCSGWKWCVHTDRHRNRYRIVWRCLYCVETDTDRFPLGSVPILSVSVSVLVLSNMDHQCNVMMFNESCLYSTYWTSYQHDKCLCISKHTKCTV